MPGLTSELEGLKTTFRSLLGQLQQISGDLANAIEKRTKMRQEAVEKLSRKLEPQRVRLSLLPHQRHSLPDLSQNRALASSKFTRDIVNRPPGFPVWQRAEEHAYFSALDAGDGYEFEKALYDLFDDSDLPEFYSLVQDDDLQIEFEPHAGAGYKHITNLSAGQRCTAVFPILLNVGRGPLIIDQPEDNLNNRYISEEIAPTLLKDKQYRQLMFTSHNANLVVLSDCENIIAFDSDGIHGRIVEQGFLATRESDIKDYVLGILDGGARALRQRMKKYGES